MTERELEMAREYNRDVDALAPDVRMVYFLVADLCRANQFHSSTISDTQITSQVPRVYGPAVESAMQQLADKQLIFITDRSFKVGSMAHLTFTYYCPRLEVLKRIENGEGL